MALGNGSQMLAKNWVFIDKQSDTPDKIKLSDLHNVEFPKLKDEISTLSEKWDEDSKLLIDSLLIVIETQLFNSHKFIMEVYTNKFNMVKPLQLHSRWEAKLGDRSTALDAISHFNYPQPVMVKDFSDVFKDMSRVTTIPSTPTQCIFQPVT